MVVVTIIVMVMLIVVVANMVMAVVAETVVIMALALVVTMVLRVVLVVNILVIMNIVMDVGGWPHQSSWRGVPSQGWQTLVQRAARVLPPVVRVQGGPAM